MSSALTNGVKVDAESFFVPERSSSGRGVYFFAYRIQITNLAEVPVRLVSRHWIITDGNGRTEEIRGSGVVGSQPRLEPGDSFSYQSACPLPTVVGSMHGTYQMEYDDGRTFGVEIAPFTLAGPFALN